MRWTSFSAAVSCAIVSIVAVHASDRRPASALSGRTFQSQETQQLEADDGANPGMLWVEQGAELWRKAEGAAGKSCASCHGETAERMKGVAAAYPKADAATGKLLNLEGRINQCRTERMAAPVLAYESQGLLGLTVFVTHQSRGMPRKVAIDGVAKPFFETGQAFYATRQGQLNLACGQCHDDNAGKRLRGDTISQGQSNGWPAYRLEWQTLGSLHRRLRACSLGVRAEILDYGAPEYLALELYLGWRGEGLPIESPGVRR
jgi:L-cysteine S-thiosulfotransferase